MKKLLYLLLSLSVSLSVLARDEFYLSGRVKESFGKTDLLDAYVLLYDSIGNVRDSIKTNQAAGIRTAKSLTCPRFISMYPKKIRHSCSMSCARAIPLRLFLTDSTISESVRPRAVFQ